MKITDYTLNNDPNPESEYVVCAYNGQNYKILTGNLNFFSPHNKMIPRISDFMGSNDDSVFVISGVGAITTENNHPGKLNLGAPRLEYKSSAYVFLGNEVMEGIFVSTIIGAATIGYVQPAGPGNEAIYIDITALGVLTGKTSNGGVVSTTGTSYTISANTWYRFKIALNAAKTNVDFFLYDDNGNLLWNSNLTTNIPASVTEVYPFPGGNIYLDWLAFYNNTELVR